MSCSLDKLLDFISVCIIEYLYVRGVYPAFTFERARALDVIVRKTRIPELSTYVARALSEAKSYLAQGHLRSVVVLLLDKKGQVVEKLDFALVGQGSVSSLELTEEDCRGTLARISRLQAVSLEVSEFTLTFEVDADFHTWRRGVQVNSEQDFWLTREDPVVSSLPHSQNTVVPISTFANDSNALRLCTSIETQEV